MNSETSTKRDKLNHALSVIGFLAVIIFIAWCAIQIVRIAPSAFNSLASLSQGINQYRDSLQPDADGPLVIQSETASTTSGTPIELSWKRDGRLGRYAFSHSCRDGMTVELVDTEGLRALSCGTRYDLGDIDTITIIVNSETEPIVEMPYIISFMRTNDTEPVRVGESTVTVVNDEVAMHEETPTEGSVLGESDDTSKEDTPVVVTKPSTPTPVYTLPTSDPNGYSDLKTTFIATGRIVGGKFVKDSLKQNEEGALQFEIQNIGTKLSEKWSYSVLLPDSETYTSPLQAPLMPTERVIISIGFPTDNDSSHAFAVVVAEASDKNLTNNTFRQVTKLLK